MISSSVLQKKALRGPLYYQGAVKSKTGFMKNTPMVFSLNLTALIDAFSILVIFLLSNYNGDPQNLNMKGNITLPAATQSEIMTMGTVVRIEGNKFTIDEKTVTIDQLVHQLIDAKKNHKELSEEAQKTLIIQADRNLDFAVLSSVIRAGGQAGFNHYRFAVLPQLHKLASGQASRK